MELHTGLIELNWTCLMILINLFIVYVILKKFFWEKIKAFMDERSQSISDALDRADAVNRQADLKLANYNKQIADVESEGRDIIKAARDEADKQAQIIIEEARIEAAKMIENANRAIELERAKAKEEIRREIATVGLMVAEQIVEKEVEATGQEAIVDEVIKKAGISSWQ